MPGLPLHSGCQRFELVRYAPPLAVGEKSVHHVPPAGQWIYDKHMGPAHPCPGPTPWQVGSHGPEYRVQLAQGARQSERLTADACTGLIRKIFTGAGDRHSGSAMAAIGAMIAMANEPITPPSPSLSSLSPRPAPRMAPHWSMVPSIDMAPAKVAAMVELGCPGSGMGELVGHYPSSSSGEKDAENPVGGCYCSMRGIFVRWRMRWAFGRDDVDFRHEEARLEEPAADMRNMRDSRFADFAGAIHLQDDLVGKPVGEEVHGQCQ